MGGGGASSSSSSSSMVMKRMARSLAASSITLISFFMTFFQFFNVPVFWPILLVYFVALFALTMKRQIKHMWKHKYLPWSSGKKSYGEVEGGPPPPKAAE